MSYPKWKYHPEKEACIVDNEAAEASLGAGWFESPADFPVKEVSEEAQPESAPEQKKKARKAKSTEGRA
jgi:hypothetical protein